ncbi:hypothetical protein IEQ34_016867 [Dendrobium chrysotoxum]|uniref:Uncharacterized protein n=1 Tax=Dendrobium chrysotoxum TaxID=161865 RepID=A0AAV7GGZ9_DENCH|nr:hypothetical protein IEQ34_016867 [Dendrobium chrysotoxum]
MKRLTKICSSCSEDNEEQQPLVSHSGQSSQPPSEQRMDYQTEPPMEEAPLEPNSQSCLLDEWDRQVLQVKKRNNAFSITNVRFIDYGDTHRIVISFHNTEGRMMKLTIDNKTIYEVDTRLQFRGNTKLDIEDMVVDFVWDLIRKPVKFSFRTRGFPLDSGSSAGYGEDGELVDSDAEKWEDYEVLNLIEIVGVDG